jgi:LacI family transcriptional regulator
VSTNQGKHGRRAWPDWATAGDRSHIRNWLKHLELPVAVMACSDMFARRLIDVAMDIGLRVPGDVSILGADNDELSCETGTIPLSSIDPDNERVGFEAGLLLDRLMRREHASASTVLVPPRTVVSRQSTSIFAHKDPEIAEAMRYIHERACTDITVEAICDRIAVSRRHLERRFRQIIGHSPGEEIRHLRMERAKALLSDTNMTLTEVSVRCGYSHTSSFAAVFHDVVGMTPGQYRLKHGR